MMLTTKKICEFIEEMGLLSEEGTHMVTQITIMPFQGKVSYEAIVNTSGDTEHYHLPVFDFGDDE